MTFTPPEKIYLQIDQEFDSLEGVTWCTDRINDTDVEYTIVKKKQASGMKKDYRYRRIKCPYCGDVVADNWYIRHLQVRHPVRDILEAATK
jgi:hypothetical protein